MKYLIAMAGVPGKGKSYVSRKMVNGLDAIIVNTDALRTPEENKNLPKDKYSDDPIVREIREKGYEQMFEMARELLGHGKNVILDATFENPIWRKAARAIAEQFDAQYYMVVVTCSNPEVWGDRLKIRSYIDPSAATPEVAKGMPADYDDADFEIDNVPGKDVDGQIEQVLAKILNAGSKPQSL